MQAYALSAGWQVKERAPEVALSDDFRSTSGWIPAIVPGTVHEALWAEQRIADPYSSVEQPKNAWIAERDFLYRCRFDLPPGFAGETAVKLCCEGLDTVATVWLNGHELFRSDNMFLPVSCDVKKHLLPTGNELWIFFESALRVGRGRESERGQRAVWNGDHSRVYLRKAQYQYGWDFGPPLLGCGPWRPISLVAFAAKIADIQAPLLVAPDLKSARLPVTLTIECAPQEPGAKPVAPQVAIRLIAPNGTVVYDRTHEAPAGRLETSIPIEHPVLWWPHGHGEQPLYCLEARLLGLGSDVLDVVRLRLGARRVRLVQESLLDGEGFYFEINNRPIFCGGANWIPADLLPTRVSPARYRALLNEAVAAHMTMLRVWGGGIYEDAAFYDLCDELGILVWQDFLFACGLYPGHDDFANSVAQEATAAIRRLRHHPSLVIWAGNNEDYSIAGSVRAYGGPQEPIPPPGASSLKQPLFDGRRLYEEVLAHACAQNDCTRPYWPGSPYSRGAVDPNSPLEGDRHIWEIWHFPMLDYQEYGRVAGRFASEFGMQATPDLPTLQRALGRQAVSLEALSTLNKGQDGPGRIREYIQRNLPTSLAQSTRVEDYLYATQVVQAEALAYAVRGFRRQFDERRRCGGALVWQLDDCWPGVSWSLLAFCDEGEAVRRKPSLYALRRELAPYGLGLAFSADGKTLSAWAILPPAHQGRTPFRLCVRAFTLDGKLHAETQREVSLATNQATELADLSFPAHPAPLVYGAQLVCGSEVLARTVLWPQPLSRLPLADPGLQVERAGDRIRLFVERPAKAVLLSAEDPLNWSDNLLDLLPGEPLTVEAAGLGSRPLRIRSLLGEHGCF